MHITEIQKRIARLIFFNGYNLLKKYEYNFRFLSGKVHLN